MRVASSLLLCALTFWLSVAARFWQLATDPLPPQEAAELEEELGIERDTPEHGALERGPFCVAANGGILGKRRR